MLLSFRHPKNHLKKQEKESTRKEKKKKKEKEPVFEPSLRKKARHTQRFVVALCDADPYSKGSSERFGISVIQEISQWKDQRRDIHKGDFGEGKDTPHGDKIRRPLFGKARKQRLAKPHPSLKTFEETETKLMI